MHSAAKYMYHYTIRLERECYDAPIAPPALAPTAAAAAQLQLQAVSHSPAVLALRAQAHALLSVIQALEAVPKHQWLLMEEEGRTTEEGTAFFLCRLSVVSFVFFCLNVPYYESEKGAVKKPQTAMSDGAAPASASAAALKLVDLTHLKRKYALCSAHLQLVTEAATALSAAAAGKKGGVMNARAVPKSLRSGMNGME